MPLLPEHSIPNSIRYYRRRRHLTLAHVAKRLQLTGPAHVARWEQGRKAPSIQNALRLSIVLNVPVNCLFFDLFKQYQQELTQDIPRTNQTAL